MFALFVTGLVLVTSPLGLHTSPEDLVAPGDGLVLSPTSIVVTPVRLPRQLVQRVPGGFGAVAGTTALVGAAILGITRRRRDDEPFYVIVHGNGGSADDFGALLEKLGVAPDRVVAFDYSGGDPEVSSTAASRYVSTESAASALDKLVRGLAVDHSNIYSIHHSRGGAIGVSMISALDDGSRQPIDGYVGAALLDPAIGRGWLGALQRAGGFVSLIPDNGGFNVERCNDGECRDVRENLGVSSGVEVIAIRNPDAEITNFRDNPTGMRVYDLIHDGAASAWLYLPLSPVLSVLRVLKAHRSVLERAAVADCIAAEVVAAGSCVWDGGRRASPVRQPGRGRRRGGGGRNVFK